ncbi:MAG: redoxin domain-containing protein [Bacteroidales bacterium]|nr:redoxin domain-containing protein [Bacteroidales bacterium]MDE6802598.1 peroxiredoxin family protein [Muribaculaceae bacterium]
MKKAILFVASFAILIISMSAFTDKASAPVIGYKAPELILQQDDQAITLSSLKGKYVLLNFWTSSDADSRMKCNLYDDISSDKDNLSLISVNLDSSNALYREIVKRDGLNSASQFHMEGSQASKVHGLYRLNKNLKSFLIDPAGRILAVNPDAQRLAAI